MHRISPVLVLLTLCGCGGNDLRALYDFAEITALTERLAKLEGAEKSGQAEVKPDADEKADKATEAGASGSGWGGDCLKKADAAFKTAELFAKLSELMDGFEPTLPEAPRTDRFRCVGEVQVKNNAAVAKAKKKAKKEIKKARKEARRRSKEFAKSLPLHLRWDPQWVLNGKDPVKPELMRRMESAGGLATVLGGLELGQPLACLVEEDLVSKKAKALQLRCRGVGGDGYVVSLPLAAGKPDGVLGKLNLGDLVQVSDYKLVRQGKGRSRSWIIDKVPAGGIKLLEATTCCPGLDEVLGK